MPTRRERLDDAARLAHAHLALLGLVDDFNTAPPPFRFKPESADVYIVEHPPRCPPITAPLLTAETTIELAAVLVRGYIDWLQYDKPPGAPRIALVEPRELLRLTVDVTSPRDHSAFAELFDACSAGERIRLHVDPGPFQLLDLTLADKSAVFDTWMP